MRKIIIAVAIAGAALLGIGTQQAQAQTYPNVAGLTAFSPGAQYMSLPGYLRFRYYQQSGQWISREQAVQIARDQGADTGPAPQGNAG